MEECASTPGDAGDFCSLSSRAIDSQDFHSTRTDWVVAESNSSNLLFAPIVPSSDPDCAIRPVSDLLIPCHQVNNAPKPDVDNKSSGSEAKKPIRLSVEEKLRLTHGIHPRERIGEDNRAERLAARQLWNRLISPTPDDPFDHEEGFTDSVFRIAKWGTSFLDMADKTGNGIAKTKPISEMYQKRRNMQRSGYMRHFQEYLSARAVYIQKYRRLRDFRAMADILKSVDCNELIDSTRYHVFPHQIVPRYCPHSTITPRFSSYYHPFSVAASSPNAPNRAQHFTHVASLDVSPDDI